MSVNIARLNCVCSDHSPLPTYVTYCPGPPVHITLTCLNTELEKYTSALIPLNCWNTNKMQPIRNPLRYAGLNRSDQPPSLAPAVPTASTCGSSISHNIHCQQQLATLCHLCCCLHSMLPLLRTLRAHNMTEYDPTLHNQHMQLSCSSMLHNHAGRLGRCHTRCASPSSIQNHMKGVSYLRWIPVVHHPQGPTASWQRSQLLTSYPY